VVVDPVAERLAHLIVAPERRETSRLVPMGMARCEQGRIVLDCSREGFESLEPAVEAHFVAPHGAEVRDGYPAEAFLYWPYFGLGTGQPMFWPAPDETNPLVELEDRVPLDEVRIRRGERVRARDGGIGRVRGLVVDAADEEKVTHVLLDEGHLWGRKQVAIPIGMVYDIDEEEVAVRLSKQQIKDLPPVEVMGLD
jgi:hypothetical protein